MRKQIWMDIRIGAKIVSLAFILGGVFLFIWQFAPEYTGKGVVFGFFVFAGVVWAIDTLCSACRDIGKIE